MLTNCSHLTANLLALPVIPWSTVRDRPRKLPQSVVIVAPMDATCLGAR